MSNNKLRTPGYFIKRLRDNGFVVIRLFSVYAKSDPRRWTVMVNPSETSVMITCYANKTVLGEILFEINDGGCKIPKTIALRLIVSK
jgi:predicted RNA binding protein YcfA (HicA-like mRNA interferase family)